MAFTLPADVVNDLRALAKREFRSASQEVELALVRHLALAQIGAAE